MILKKDVIVFGSHSKIEYIAADISIDWEETLGDCRAEIYILGQTFTFEYTITR